MSNLASRLRALWLIFTLTAVVLGANGWFLYENFGSFESQQTWVAHTHQVIWTLEKVVSSLIDAESSQRSYMLQTNPKALQHFQEGVDHTFAQVATVRQLVQDNPVQVREVAQLEKLVGERVHFLQLTLEGFEHSHKLPSSFNGGDEMMDSVRRQVELMDENERQLLARRELSSDKQKSFLILTILGSTVLSIVCALATFVFVRRYIIAQADEGERRAREARLGKAEAEAAKLSAGDISSREISEGLVDFVCENLGFLAANVYAESDGQVEFLAGHLLGEGNLRGPHSRARARFRMGEGLVGKAALAADVQVVSDVPDDYFFRVSSSMGEAKARWLIFVPLHFQGEHLGVVEIACFKEPSAEQVDILRNVIRAVGAGFASSRSRQRLQELLEETQRQGEEMQSQQEELRTTNEELEEQTKALSESQQRMQVQAEELRQVNEELEQQARTLEASQENLNLKNQALETSRRRLEEKAQELERASTYKSEFLAKMSHELRTPLNSLMILATILQENKKGNLDVQQVEFARTIYDAGTDLLDLINDILDLSKIEARKLQVRAEPFSPRQFVEQLANLFRPQAESRALRFDTRIAESVPDKVKTDRQRLQQILRNLISNAMKFTEKGGITLEASVRPEQPDRLRLSVIDTGIGVPAEKMKLIWEAFEQADSSISRRFGGTGLGLTISRELAQLLQGQIDAESTPGKGSRFTLDIPFEIASSMMTGDSLFGNASAQPAEAPVIPHSPEAAPAAATGGEFAEKIKTLLDGVGKDEKSILVVEDDAKFRASVCEAIRMHGFVPIAVGDGETALALLKEHVPKAILLDIRLPGISGMALLDMVKKISSLRHVPIHMISALEHQHDALRLGAVGYLGKPVTIEGVRAALGRIESVIERRMKRILVVEDDFRQRQVIADLVSGPDSQITAVGTGREALSLLQAGGIDCVILDLKLPDMTGFELLEGLDEHAAHNLPPVIVYTGKELSRDEEDRLRRYSDSIIIKGAKSPERLLDEVSLFLHRMESDIPQEKKAMLSDVRSKDSSFAGRHVLLVDDDLRNLFALTSALEAKGFKVTVARDGLEALEKLDQHADTDVVLMDIMMPKLDGFEAMKRIRANPTYKGLPIIALTAKAMQGEHERCVQAGASDYLPKPIDLSSLLSVLKVWLPAHGIMT